MGKNKENNCSLFEEMLMWTSYRYCIGRHTYVTSMAREIAQHYYDKLSYQRKEFTAQDIRREIYDHLKFFPCNFSVEGMYNGFDALDLFLNFIKKENIQSLDELLKYNSIRYVYNYRTYESHYEATKYEPTINSYLTSMDIEDLIVWMNLANCFDTKLHQMITDKDGKVIECFKTWVPILVPVDGESYYRRKEFGWEEAWVPVESYIGTVGNFSYITNTNIENCLKNK